MACLCSGRAGAAELLTTTGWLDGLAVLPTDEASERQRPQLMGMLRFDAAPKRWLHGRLELRGRVGGPFEGGPGPGVWNFHQEFQNRSPSLDVNEGWVELRGREAELRLGIQTFAWGKLDGIPPTDVLNPRDYHDPIVQDAEERKIGIPALLGTYYLPDVERFDLTGLRASLVYVPLAVPPRLALVEERWFPASLAVPGRFRLPMTIRGNPIPEDYRRPIVDFGTSNAAPPASMQGGAARLSGTFRSADWDLYHYTGPETNPDASLQPAFALRASPDIREKDRLVVFTRLAQESDRIHMTGADVAVPWGGFTIRAEGAWFVDRPYLRPSSDLVSPSAIRRLAAQPRVGRAFARVLAGKPGYVTLDDLFVDLDSIEWGIGADYLWRGFVPLLQVNQIVLLEDSPRLLIGRPDTRLLGSIKKTLLDDRLELEMRGVYQAERGGWFFMPRISYQVRDDFRVRLGYLAIGGSRNSIIGQFRANDEVVFQARYTF